MRQITGAISPYKEFCAGYQNPGASGHGYIMTLSLSAGISKIQLSHDGSSILDQTNAFDLAEVEGAYLGQTNMITVSSFCGPHGSIWGYHIAKQDLAPHDLVPHSYALGGNTINVYSAGPLISATKSLFGTVNSKKFPILPGSHIPCAYKSTNMQGPAILYGAIGIGIPDDGKTNACLMMEDVGKIPGNLSIDELSKYKSMILTNMIKSVLLVAENQKLKYKEVLVEIKVATLKENEMGCVLVAAPYITLAQNAVPKSGIQTLSDMTLQEWENSIQ